MTDTLRKAAHEIAEIVSVKRGVPLASDWFELAFPAGLPTNKEEAARAIIDAIDEALAT